MPDLRVRAEFVLRRYGGSLDLPAIQALAWNVCTALDSPEAEHRAWARRQADAIDHVYYGWHERDDE